MKFECPYCEVPIEADNKKSGIKVPCPNPKCKRDIIVPEPNESTIEIFPKVDYPSLSVFGKRIRDVESYEKKKVAHYVVKNFLTQGAAAFICDGSSTFFVGLKIFQEAKRRVINKELPLDVTIFTNNLGIAHEYALWNSPQGKLPAIKVYSTGGDVSADLMMESGEQAKEMAAKSAAMCGPYLILAVRAILAREGPVGLNNAQDVIIKQAALKSGEGLVKGVIFIADHTKLSQPYNDGMPTLFNDIADWERLKNKTNTFIVSTTHPKYRDSRPPVQGHNYEYPQTEEECYTVNCRRLGDVMNGDFSRRRFILLD